MKTRSLQTRPTRSHPTSASPRTARLAAIAAGVFAFAAALTASAQVEECERCRVERDHCVLSAESPAQAQGCETRYQRCTSTLDCPAPEAR